MSPRDLANLEAALAALVSGRANAARRTLEVVLRENGGSVPLPFVAPPRPAPQSWLASWMRPSA